MSAVAKKLAAAPPSVDRVRRGPTNVCGPIYEPDIEDAEAINDFRQKPTESWATAQAMYDNLLGVDKGKRITNDKFRYHWRRRCFCWPDDLRLS